MQIDSKKIPFPRYINIFGNMVKKRFSKLYKKKRSFFLNVHIFEHKESSSTNVAIFEDIGKKGLSKCSKKNLFL